jgi:hypothetical protein
MGDEKTERSEEEIAERVGDIHTFAPGSRVFVDTRLPLVYGAGKNEEQWMVRIIKVYNTGCSGKETLAEDIEGKRYNFNHWSRVVRGRLITDEEWEAEKALWAMTKHRQNNKRV